MIYKDILSFYTEIQVIKLFPSDKHNSQLIKSIIDVKVYPLNTFISMLPIYIPIR